MPRTIRCFDYVNQSYARVREALAADPVQVFQAATKAASTRARTVAVALHVDIGGMEITKDVVVAVSPATEDPGGVRSPAKTTLHLEWQAAKSPGLFPLMRAELSIYPLTATETQLDFDGHYEPPFGPLGGALDVLVGHRIAEACVHRFLGDVAAHLRQSLQSR